MKTVVDGILCFITSKQANKLLILMSSAMPFQVKRASLSQEVLRRLRNTRRDLPWSEKAEILSEFSHKLMCSGSGCPITVPLLFSYCPLTKLSIS